MVHSGGDLHVFVRKFQYLVFLAIYQVSLQVKTFNYLLPTLVVADTLLNWMRPNWTTVVQPEKYILN